MHLLVILWNFKQAGFTMKGFLGAHFHMFLLLVKKSIEH